jgi:coenzyme F420-reducing hydrogenase beta subunit
MNYFDTLDKTLCCGCTACASVCPVTCIAMEEDSSGFLYPKVDKDKCINCGLCKKVCPFATSEKLKNKASDHCYELLINDKIELMKSASGGAFKSIVDTFCNTNFVVFGAELLEDLSVRHTMAQNIEEVNKFRKSKYVQSDTSNIYPLVKQSLAEGKKVLFSGTGCQVAGLKGFLQKDYDNLITVDLVCHGVPSRKIFSSYINALEKQYHKKIKTYEFRAKTLNKGGLLDVKVSFEDGKTKKIKSQFDMYLRTFLKSIMFMPSCYECKFACAERTSDITIADFWGSEKIKNSLEAINGISLMIPNTDKGNKLINKINNASLLKTELENAIAYNGNLKRPSPMNPDREQFLELAHKDFRKAANKYCKVSPKIRLKVFLLTFMPKWLKTFIKKIIR